MIMQKNEILTHVVTDDKVLDRADIFMKKKDKQHYCLMAKK